MIGYKDCPSSTKYILEKGMCQSRLTFRAHIQQNSLARILEINHLIDTNYKDWLRNLKIILTSEKLSYILDQDLVVLLNRPTTEQRAVFEK